MNFLIDTNIASAFLRGHRAVTSRFMQYAGGLCISSICVGELYAWAMRDKNRGVRLAGVVEMLQGLTELAVDRQVAERFGAEHARLLDLGRPTPPLDLYIACTALHYNLTMVTANTKDFEHVPGLRCQNWLE